jgi:hypothetical protein
MCCYACGYGQPDRRWQAFARAVMVAKSPGASKSPGATQNLLSKQLIRRGLKQRKRLRLPQMPHSDIYLTAKPASGSVDPALAAGFLTLSTLWPVMCDDINRQQHIAATSLSVCGFGRSPVRVICQALGSRSTMTTVGCT